MKQLLRKRVRKRERERERERDRWIEREREREKDIQHQPIIGIVERKYSLRGATEGDNMQTRRWVGGKNE